MARTVDPELNQKRRDQILEAAAACFASRGFHQSTMQDITAASGMSAGGVYRYFKSKDDIIVGIAEAEGIEYDALIEVLDGEPDTVTALEIITPWILSAMEEPGYGRIAIEVIAEAGRNPRVAEVLSANEDRFRKALIKSLKRGQTQGYVDKSLPAGQTVEMIIALFNGLPAGELGHFTYRPTKLKPVVRIMLQRLLRAG